MCNNEELTNTVLKGQEVSAQDGSDILVGRNSYITSLGFNGVLFIWLIAGYILPQTIVDNLSAKQIVFSDVGGVSFSRLMFLLTGILGLGTRYLWLTRGNHAKTCLVFAIFLYLVVIVLEGAAYRSSPAEMSEAYIVASSLFIGLLVPLLGVEVGSLVVSLVALATFQGVLALLGLLLGHQLFLSGTIPRAGGTIGQPALLYVTLLLVLPIATAGAIKACRKKDRNLWFLAIGILLCALVFTWMRGGIIAAACSMIWLASKSVKQRSIVAFVVVLLVGLIALSAYVRTAGTINAESSARSIHGHLMLPRRGLHRFVEHLWLGEGIGHEEFAVPEREYGQQVIAQYWEPKNQALFWLDQLGLLGGFLVLVGMRSLWFILKRVKGITALTISSIWIAVVVACISDTLFCAVHRECGNCLLGLLLGMTLLLTDGSLHHSEFRSCPIIRFKHSV